jgi:hypothetical protein
MKTFTFFLISTLFILTGCITIHKSYLEVSKEKSEEAWSKGLSFLMGISPTTIRTYNRYYIDNYPSQYRGVFYNAFSMNRIITTTKTTIFIKTLDICKKFNTAEACKNYILHKEVIPEKFDKTDQIENKVIKQSDFDFKYKEPFKQAYISDIPPLILEELLKSITRSVLIHKLDIYKVSVEEVKKLTLTGIKKRIFIF